MDTLEAYKKGQEARMAGKPLRNLDWKGLVDFVEQHKDVINSVFAGLVEDWDWTGDEVYHEDFGWIEDNYAYTESIWATPIAYIHYKDGCDEILSVFKDCIEEKNDQQEKE